MRHSEIKNKVNEGGLADLAQRAEQDHEVQMARSDLYKLAKYSIKLHEMLKMLCFGRIRTMHPKRIIFWYVFLEFSFLTLK